MTFRSTTANSQLTITALHSGANAPFWVILSCALAISIGTYLGGWRVVRTLGKGLVEIEAPQGMAAESASAAVILLSSSFGASMTTGPTSRNVFTRTITPPNADPVAAHPAYAIPALARSPPAPTSS